MELLGSLLELPETLLELMGSLLELLGSLLELLRALLELLVGHWGSFWTPWSLLFGPEVKNHDFHENLVIPNVFNEIEGLSGLE